MVQREQIVVAGDEVIGLSGFRQPQDVQIVGVAAGVGGNGGGLQQRSIFAEQPFDARHCLPLQLHFLGEISANLIQQRLAQQDFVAAQTKLEERFAQPSRGEGRHHDVGVQHDPHEMARKTSSSVNSPWASAKGSVLLRSKRNRSMAT